MTRLHNNGGPAFPAHHTTDKVHGGMSLRDWFAGQSLPRLVHDGKRLSAEVAQLAYEIADAMLSERERTNDA